MSSMIMNHNIFSCDQAALWMVVHLSVTPFSLCSHDHIIMKFAGVITMDKSNVHAKGQGHKSKVKIKEVKANFSQIWVFMDHNSSLN